MNAQIEQELNNDLTTNVTTTVNKKSFWSFLLGSLIEAIVTAVIDLLKEKYEVTKK